MNISKQKGFSLIEISLGICMLAVLLVVTMLLASPKKKNENSVTAHKSQESSQTIEKETPVLQESSFKSVH